MYSQGISANPADDASETKKSADLRTQELKPGDKFTGAAVGTSFYQHHIDRSTVLIPGVPHFGRAAGFQNLVAEAAKNHGPRYEISWVTFDQEYGLHEAFRERSGWHALKHG